MAMNDSAVLTAAVGYIFTAPVDTAAPGVQEVDDFTASTTLEGWDNIGHTSRDELPVFGYDGGDTEVKGTWQNATFKTVVTEVATDYVTFNVHQFDSEGLALYYGTSGGSEAGVFSVSEAPTTATQRALLIVIRDGDTNIAFYAPKVDIRREDSIELAVDEFAYLPLRATFLKTTTPGLPLFSWISNATGINPDVA